MNNLTYYAFNASTHFIFIFNIDQKFINNFGIFYPITSFIIGLFFYNVATKEINSKRILYAFLFLNLFVSILLLETQKNSLFPILYAVSFITTDLVASRYYKKQSIIPILAALSPILVFVNSEIVIYTRALLAILSVICSDYRKFEPINLSNGIMFTLLTHIYLYAPLTIYSMSISAFGCILNPLNYILLSASLTITLRAFDLKLRDIISSELLNVVQLARGLVFAALAMYFTLTDQFFELFFVCITYAFLERLARKLGRQLT